MIVFTYRKRSFAEGQTAIAFEIDEIDFHLYEQYGWFINNGYPTTNIDGDYGRRQINFHLLALDAAGIGFRWDHIDRNRLNNKRDNLRKVSNIDNARNCNIRKDNTSGVKGVKLCRSQWMAYIGDGSGGRIQVYCGSFEEAVAVRHALEKKLGYPT